MGKISFTYTAPKWAGTSQFIKKLAFMNDLEYKIEVEKGWFRESVLVLCSGTDENIKKFNDALKSAIDRYNNYYKPI